MSAWTAVQQRASEDASLPERSCAQCFLKLCKVHPRQDHGQATARLTSAAKASTLDKMYESFVAPQIDKHRAAQAPEDDAAARAYRESNARERDRATKRKRRDVGADALALGRSGLAGDVVKFMTDRDRAPSSSSSSASSSDGRADRKREKKKRRKEEKKRLKKAAKKVARRRPFFLVVAAPRDAARRARAGAQEGEEEEKEEGAEEGEAGGGGGGGAPPRRDPRHPRLGLGRVLVKGVFPLQRARNALASGHATMIGGQPHRAS